MKCYNFKRYRFIDKKRVECFFLIINLFKKKKKNDNY